MRDGSRLAEVERAVVAEDHEAGLADVGRGEIDAIAGADPHAVRHSFAEGAEVLIGQAVQVLLVHRLRPGRERGGGEDPKERQGEATHDDAV